MDGAEFYRDQEFNVWSISSLLAKGDATKLQTVDDVSQTHAKMAQVWDCKFPVVIIPHYAMTLPQAICLCHALPFCEVKASANRAIADVLAWSFEIASKGTFPTKGFYDEDFCPKSWRYSVRGSTVANGWRAAYWAFRADGKARVQCNLFDHMYSARYVCDQCLAQRATARADKEMLYTDFRPDRPRHFSRIDDATYRNTCITLSPYSCIPGWHLWSVVHDIMHVVFLGTAQDLLPSLLYDWLEAGMLGGGVGVSHDAMLKAFSVEMNMTLKSHGMLGPSVCAL